MYNSIPHAHSSSAPPTTPSVIQTVRLQASVSHVSLTAGIVYVRRFVGVSASVCAERAVWVYLYRTAVADFTRLDRTKLKCTGLVTFDIASKD